MSGRFFVPDRVSRKLRPQTSDPEKSDTKNTDPSFFLEKDLHCKLVLALSPKMFYGDTTFTQYVTQSRCLPSPVFKTLKKKF